MTIKAVYFIWTGIFLILLGVGSWYYYPVEATNSVILILVGTLVWIYGDLKARVKLFRW